MSSNAPFKICIILSACIHLTILYPWPLLRSIRRLEIPSQKIELTYFREGPVKEVIIRDIKPITLIKRKDEKENIKTAKQKEVRHARTKALEAVVPLEAETYIEVKTDLKSEMSKDSHDKKSIIEKSASEDEGVFESYYLKVREKIKSALEKNCKGRIKEGEVSVRFKIARDGILKELMVYKSSSNNMERLERVAIKSIKEASPFPPFDEEINETELLFRQAIQITHQP